MAMKTRIPITSLSAGLDASQCVAFSTAIHRGAVLLWFSSIPENAKARFIQKEDEILGEISEDSR